MIRTPCVIFHHQRARSTSVTPVDLPNFGPGDRLKVEFLNVPAESSTHRSLRDYEQAFEMVKITAQSGMSLGTRDAHNED